MKTLQISRSREAFDRREILRALRAFGQGDLSVRMPPDLTGIDGEIAEVFNDIVRKNETTESGRAALEEKVEQLESISRYKSEFLANMSHELRTPLNSLLILAQLLAENPASNLTPRQIEYARTIYAAGNDLLALINDVLDLAKVESGTVTLTFATERIRELCDYLEGAFRQSGQDKDLRFGISLGRNLPLAFRTDAKRLRQILRNLLSNAFKFTAKGAVSLRIAMVTSGWTPGHPVLDAEAKVIAFSVSDTGIGIAPGNKQIIFEAFQQADGTTSRHFGGTGLGLSISAKLSRLLGGEIKVKSSPGKGSRFTLYLPLVQKTGGANVNPAATAHAEQNASRHVPPISLAAPSSTGKATPALAGRKVLLVDDDIRNIFALTSALEQQGMIVMNAENGVDGIEMLKNSPKTDIILIDMMMPDLDGYETIRAMRNIERFKGVPIIGVSARAMKDDRAKCIEAGASDYISKPMNVDHLLLLIRAWLAK